ncbi:MAG: ribosome recycling factor [Chloroflexota bacterium]
MLSELLEDAQERMNKSIDSLNTDLASIRTGRASPSLVDRLSVDYFGTPTPLLQLAAISTPEADQLLIRPFSPTDISLIEKTILSSDLGINPNSDGKQIRLIIPPLTEERRRQITKQVSQRAEDGRVAVRNIRRDIISDLREMERESMISEDELHDGQDKVQALTNEVIKTIDERAKAKEAEVMTI